jgi:phage shock protein C
MQQVNDQRFYRSNNRILGGVCAGLAEGFGVDPLWVRVAFVILLFLQGVGLFIYVVLWLVMPERLEDGSQRSGFDAMTSDLRRISLEIRHQLGGGAPTQTPAPTSAPGGPSPAVPPSTADPRAIVPGPQPQGVWQNQALVLGVILVVLGLVLLGANIGIINWTVVWPAALITLGIVLLVRNLERHP